MTPFGRHPELDVKQLTRWAINEGLADAGIAPSAIEAAYFANATQGHMEGQHMVRGEIALRSMGIGEIPVVNVENACASGSTALQLAVTALKAGDADIALAVGAEKMVSPDRNRMFSAFDGAWDVATKEANLEKLVSRHSTAHGTSPRKRRTWKSSLSSAKAWSRRLLPRPRSLTASSWMSTRLLRAST
jgi:acetyl-CoA acetyltransferase